MELFRGGGRQPNMRGRDVERQHAMTQTTMPGRMPATALEMGLGS